MEDTYMKKRHEIAPCGLDCFNCSGYEENITEEYKTRVAEYFKISPEETICRGCRPEKGKCIWAGNGCATWACAEKKGVTYCFECDEFPCGLLAPSAKGADYPHNIKLYNLCRIKLLGVDAWIEESANIRKRYYEGNFVVGQGPILEDE
jgi:hypothetical protein